MTNDKIVPLSSDAKMFNSVEQAIADIQAGKFVIVADDEGRENEGDLICAASAITPEMVNFMTKEARGLICVSITAAQAEKLGLEQMVNENTDPNQTAFTVSIDAGPEFGVTTGISAQDRAATIVRMTASNATPQDFRRPGHIFPVQAKNGGVLRRVGHSEASVDLARLAGLTDMGVMCEILNDDGSMARRDDLVVFAKKHNLSFITVAQLVAYRLQHERDVVRRVTKEIETKFGKFTAIAYKDMLDGAEHLALIKGPIEQLAKDAPYVRVQHENIITDVLGRVSEEVPHEMAQALSFIEAQGKGAVIYLRHRDDSAHGLVGSLKAYNQETPQRAYDMGKADLRDYGVGAQILVDLGIKSFRMLGKSTRKIVALRGYGLEIVDNMPLATGENFDFSGPDLNPPAVPAFISAQAQHEAHIAKLVASYAIPSETVAPLVQQAAQAQAEQAQIPEQPQAPIAASVQTPAIQTAVETPIMADVQQPAPQSVQAPQPVVIAVAHDENATVPVAPPVVDVQPTEIAAVATPTNVMPMPRNENKKMNGSSSSVPDALLREPRPVTMKMGGQIISNQALFEG